MLVSGAREQMLSHAGVYDNMVRETLTLRNKHSEQIDLDLHRTFPDNVHFRETIAKTEGEPRENGYTKTSDQLRISTSSGIC